MVNYKGNHCAAGHYCPAGSTSAEEKKCPAGTYSDRRDLHDPLDCVACPRGHRCAEGSTSDNGNIQPCPEHHFCPEGTTDTGQIACPSGTWAPYTSSKSLEDCVPCPIGSYCLAGQGKAICLSGYYCPESTNSSTEYPCPAGFYNPDEGAKDIMQCLPCGVGNHCPAASSQQQQCPEGTFNNATNMAGECTACLAGHECAPAGQIHPTPCAAGKYADVGASACEYCPPGHFCPNIGTNKTTLFVDQVCPAGVLCTRTVTAANGSSIIVGLDVWPRNDLHGCATGHYCPRGTVSAIACPLGTYNPTRARKDESDCVVAEAGRYVSTTGASAVSGTCAAGHYCPAGSASATAVPCPKGTYRTSDGAVGGGDAASCAACPSGTYCEQTGTSSPQACPAGHYCPVGTIWPEPCPVGTYSD